MLLPSCHVAQLTVISDTRVEDDSAQKATSTGMGQTLGIDADIFMECPPRVLVILCSPVAGGSLM